MKRFFARRLLVLLMAFSLVVTPGVNAFADDGIADVDGVEVQNIESVLAEAVPFDGDKPATEVLQSQRADGIAETTLDSATREELRDWGFVTDDVTKVETVRDNMNNPNETLTKYVVDNEHYVCVDSENRIYSIYNSGEDILAPTWDDEFATTEEQYLATGEQVKEILGLDNSYELVCSEETTVDFWFLAYRKVLANGMVNENDGFNLTVARKDASVAFLNTFDMPANTLTAEITESQALAAAQPIINDLNGTVDGAELKYVRPNYYWKADGEFAEADFVRLAYQISLNGGAYYIDVDAVTGEVIGGDMAMGSGGAFGDEYILEAEAIIKLGKVTLGNILGYSPIYSRCASTNQTKNEIVAFLQRSDARAFFFNGHGWITEDNKARISVKSGGATNSPVVWRLYLRDLANYNQNLNFVFLSCCLVGIDSVANAFNIYSSSQNKAFMGFTDTIKFGGVSKFNRVFWDGVGDSRLYNCAIYAKNSVVGTGYDIPLNFVGDRYYWGNNL